MEFIINLLTLVNNYEFYMINADIKTLGGVMGWY